jgi:lysophospholipase L1-like esterase
MLLLALLFPGSAHAADPCFGDVGVGVDAIMDDAAVEQLLRNLHEAGPDCARPLLSAFRDATTGPMSEVVRRGFADWNEPHHLPLLYAEFGRGMLEPFGRHENIVSAMAGAVGTLLGPDGDYLKTTRDPSIAREWRDRAATRYRTEWEAGFSETSGPPPDELWKPLADAAYLACLNNPDDAPPDPFDPLGLMTGPLPSMAVGTRCASQAVLVGWREAEPEREWAKRISGLMDRYNRGGLDWLGLEMERTWGQGTTPPGSAAPSWARPPRALTAQRGPAGASAAAVGLALLVMIGLLVRSERGREWLKRGAAGSFGLSLLLGVEVGAGLVGVEPGDELRPLPDPRLTLTLDGVYHRDARQRSFSASPPAGRARIVVVGGSTIVGPGLAEDESIPGVLRARLQDAVGCVDVINAGAHGVASPAVRSRAVDAVDRLHADVVVVYTGHNEVGFMREKDRYLGALVGSFPARAWAMRTRWWTLLSDYIPEEAPAPSGPDGSGPESQLLNDEFLLAVQRTFDRELTDLVRALRRRGVPLVLVQPGFNHHGLRVPVRNTRATEQTVETLRGGDLAHAMRLSREAVDAVPNHPTPWFLRSLVLEASGDLAGAEAAIWTCARANHSGSSVTPGIAGTIERLARRRGVTLVDAHALLHVAAGEHLPGFDLFTDYVHVNPRGAQVVADGIMEALDLDALRRKCAPP